MTTEQEYANQESAEPDSPILLRFMSDSIESGFNSLSEPIEPEPSDPKHVETEPSQLEHTIGQVLAEPELVEPKPSEVEVTRKVSFTLPPEAKVSKDKVLSILHF